MQLSLGSGNSGWIGKFASAAGLAGGGIAVTELFGILKTDPAKTLSIVDKWGPVFIIVFFLVLIIYSGMDRAARIAEAFVENSAERDEASIAAQTRTAAALEKLSEKDDRQVQEIQTLSAYTAQLCDRITQKQDLQDAAFQRIEVALKINPSHSLESETGGKQ